jgi:PadR family transcriptional regulator PadR
VGCPMMHFDNQLNLSYIVRQMAQVDSLGQFEQLVLTAIVTLGEGAYGVTIHKKVHELAHPKAVSLGAVYVTLDRLEDKGLISSWLSDPTPERGGRSKRHYKLLAPGERVLQESIAVAQRVFEAIQKSWGFPEPPGHKKWKPIRQS